MGGALRSSMNLDGWSSMTSADPRRVRRFCFSGRLLNGDSQEKGQRGGRLDRLLEAAAAHWVITSSAPGAACWAWQDAIADSHDSLCSSPAPRSRLAAAKSGYAQVWGPETDAIAEVLHARPRPLAPRKACDRAGFQLTEAIPP